MSLKGTTWIIPLINGLNKKIYDQWNVCITLLYMHLQPTIVWLYAAHRGFIISTKNTSWYVMILELSDTSWLNYKITCFIDIHTSVIILWCLEFCGFWLVAIFSSTAKNVSGIILVTAVEYFNQCTGAWHGLCFSNLSFQHFQIFSIKKKVVSSILF